MLLLDTQAAVWLLDDNPRLGPSARAAIVESARVHVSSASVWELTIKSMLGKIAVPADLADQLVAQGLALLPVTAQHAEGLRRLPELVKHDPFDRLLIAQAACDGLRLVTADRVLLAVGGGHTLDATV